MPPEALETVVCAVAFVVMRLIAGDVQRIDSAIVAHPSNQTLHEHNSMGEVVTDVA